MIERGDIPHSIATSTLNVGGVDLVVHVLSDGTRVIESECAKKFFDALFSGAMSANDMQRAARLLGGVR